MGMTMWARIENGTVAEITDLDPAGRFHPSLQWQQVSQAGGCGPGWRWDGKMFTAPQAVMPSADELCTRVDTAADAARARVAGDPLRAVEYDRAAAEAQAFADAGYPAAAVPRTVAAWAINGRTAREAADSILAEAAAYTEALYVIRETRLAAKEQIRSLMAADEVEQAQQLAEQTIAAIEAAVAGVGNAAA